MFLSSFLYTCSSSREYDTLKRGDRVWIFDSNDRDCFRIAIVATDDFGIDYYGNITSCGITFDKDSHGWREIYLSSIYKIHNEEELMKYTRLEERASNKNFIIKHLQAD